MKTIFTFILAVGLSIAHTGMAQTIWNQTAKASASDGESYDYYGTAVAISGDYAVIGAHEHNKDVSGGNPLNYAGAAYIFERNGTGNWVEVQKIVASDRSAEADFGLSASLSGNLH